MRALLVAAGAVLCLISGSALASEYVHGYMRGNGTYVHGYYRSSPDRTVTNNYNFQGNVNPYTGATGHDYYRQNQSSPYYGTQPGYDFGGPSSQSLYGQPSSQPLYGQPNQGWGTGN